MTTEEREEIGTILSKMLGAIVNLHDTGESSESLMAEIYEMIAGFVFPGDAVAATDSQLPDSNTTPPTPNHGHNGA